MEKFEVTESDQFKIQLEEAIFWLYSHNLEQSQEFADKKYFELQQEINNLKRHLHKTPYMGQADGLSGLRRFPVYNGRFVTTWLLNEKSKTVILLEFIDSKNPKELRNIHFE